MKLTRRNFITTTAALGAGSAFTGIEAAAPAARAAVEETTAQAARYFAAKGYAPAEPAPLVTGHAFNGGLNYDESVHYAGKTRALYVVQPCARVDDALEAGKPGTLPLFAILGFLPASESVRPHRTTVLFEYLTGVANLDAKRLRITTTELARPLFPAFAGFGVREAQIRLRPLGEAKGDGAGSGWFAPRGHPSQPAYASYSVEYVMTTGVEIEIAEVAVEAEAPHHGGGSIGLDRVTMARNDRVMSWQDRLPAFKLAVEQQVRASGKPLPRGYYAILGLPQPVGRG